MKEGAWINARTGKFSWITEHASWIKNRANAESIGVPSTVSDKIATMDADFDGEGRAEILATVMKAGFIRMRGHGSFWTFEFTMESEPALWSCLEFLTNFAGPYTSCRFNNLRTGETIDMPFQDFAKEMEASPERVLRVASKLDARKYSANSGRFFIAKGGYSRLMRILKGLVPKVSSFGMITAENPQGKALSAEANNQLNTILKADLKKGNFGYVQIKGVYGTQENPFFIMNISRDVLVQLGKKHDQESVIFGSVDHAAETVTMDFIVGNQTTDTRTTSVVNFEADDYFSEYRGRKFRIPFFDDEPETEAIDSNVPKAVPSLMADEVNDPANEEVLTKIGSSQPKVGAVGMSAWGLRGSLLKHLQQLKVR